MKRYVLWSPDLIVTAIFLLLTPITPRVFLSSLPSPNSRRLLKWQLSIYHEWSLWICRPPLLDSSIWQDSSRSPPSPFVQGLSQTRYPINICWSKTMPAFVLPDFISTTFSPSIHSLSPFLSISPSPVLPLPLKLRASRVCSTQSRTRN